MEILNYGDNFPNGYRSSNRRWKLHTWERLAAMNTGWLLTPEFVKCCVVVHVQCLWMTLCHAIVWSSICASHMDDSLTWLWGLFNWSTSQGREFWTNRRLSWMFG